VALTRLVPALVLLALTGCGRSGPGSLSPSQALKSFQLSEPFRLELFAAEPDILDPVDMVFDESGRAFVAEMLDLPYDPADGKPALSRIRMLEDTDGDGRADRSTVFAENVLQVSGLLPWKGGFIVPAAPEILYLKDTDGDGRADVRQVLFTGFYQGNPEGQITNPRLAIDNWIYFSNAGNEGLIRSPAHPEQPPVQVRGADFRYHPLTGRFEAASGPAQFGSTFDDWGNRFISQNTIHARHVVIPRHYLARAPLLEVPAVVQDVYGDFHRKMYPLTQPQYWRVERTRLRQQRYDDLKLDRTEHVAGYITGAAGGTLYSGDAWPPSYLGSLFTGDVSGNLVRRDVLTPDGVTFQARPAKENVEFLASTDPWFRPTSFANAPDGNLYMMDMQREFIETPLSVPEELRKDMDFYSGNKLGRIYRLVSTDQRTSRPLKSNLGAASTAELARLLEHGNGWHRETAHRLLIERQDKAAAPVLRQMAAKSLSPQARVRALWVLEAIGSLEPAQVRAALADPSPHVREHAIRLTESLARPRDFEKDLLAMARDQDARVHFQLAFTLGNIGGPAALETLAQLAAAHPGDRWMRIAILSSAADEPARLHAALRQRGDKELVSALASLVGARARGAELDQFLSTLSREADPQPGLAGLARGLRLSGARNLQVPGAEPRIERFLNAGVEAAWDVARFFELRGLIRRASREAVDERLAEASRSRALSALRGAQFAAAAPVLEQVLGGQTSSAIQSSALQTLSSFDDPSVPARVIAHWRNYRPEARIRAIAALVATKDRIPALLEALEKQQIEPAALDIGTRNRLLEDSDPKIAARARRLFQSGMGDRDKVVAAHRDVVQLNGDAARGKLLFAENCANCHMPRGKGGTRVGPDLSGVSVKTKEELLAAILNPSAAIESRFVNYLVTTKDGRMYDGILAAETPGSITLRGGAEEDVTLLRSRIAEIRASSISLMPEDLEKGLGKQQLADVIAYLRAGL
jgi:putative membrane-bound dehydrogenase-like protein